ncbi:MAG: type II toxin-antitoxin system RelE/ParE family toxin [Desulfopila sp.]
MKPLRLILTDTARSDLKAIYEYIAKENQTAAISFVQDLSEKLEHLAQAGVTGSSREWVSVGLWAFPYKGRCFYFRIIEDQMIVIRVLHGKQDVSAQSFYDDF